MRYIKLNYLILLVPWVSAHSWIDCISSTSPPYEIPITYSGYEFYKNCLGFPRGYPGRDNHNINQISTNLIEGHGWGNRNSVPVCGIKTQTIGNYSTEFPMTKVEAGTPLRLWYSMNGHRSPITTVSLYSYGVPYRPIINLSEINDTIKLIDFNFASFDNCQDITVNNTMCYNDWTVPTNWSPGIYSIVWFWPWNFNKVGEEYTACFEVELLDTHPNPINFNFITSPTFTPIKIPPHHQPPHHHQSLPPSPITKLVHPPLPFTTLDLTTTSPTFRSPSYLNSPLFNDCPGESQLHPVPSSNFPFTHPYLSTSLKILTPHRDP